MLRGCNSGMEVRRYFISTRPLAIYLGEMFKVSFPAYYEKYRAAFEAGVWITEDPGKGYRLQTASQYSRRWT
jgi:hypothetical protein